jgi:predicted metal-binding membrane protein
MSRLAKSRLGCGDMTNTATDRPRTAGATLAASSVSRATLLVIAAGAWIGTIVWARRTGNGPGTMGLGFLPFIGMWALMMTAMMLPAVTGRAALGRSDLPGASDGQPRHGARSVLAFGFGYLLVWVATGLPAFGAATGEGSLAGHHPDIAIAVAAAIFALAGLYQFTPAKRASLARCRQSIIPTSVHAGLRRGLVFGGWCLACSWAAMALMIVFGVMNIAAMVGLAAVVYAERRWSAGGTVRRIVGVASVAGGVLVVLWPSLAAGIHQMPSM